MEKITFHNNDSLSLNELESDIDLSIFKNLLEYVNTKLKSLGINTEGKLIYYQRYKNKTSMLAIKLNDQSDEDEKNYLIFGAEKIGIDLCPIYFHADAKLSHIAMHAAGGMQWISTFFNDFEKQLHEDNNEDLEINLCMKIENNKIYESEDKPFVKRIKNIFKKK